MAAVARAFLVWLWEREGEHAVSVPMAFLADAAAEVDGQAVTVSELGGVLQYLLDHGLLDPRAPAWGGSQVFDLPVLRAQLTAAGRACAGDFAGDVLAWSQRRSGRLDQSD